MRILVAGASGVIGSPLVAALIAAGHEVLGTTRRQQHIGRISQLGARVVLMDALDAASVDSAIEVSDPDVIIHELTDLADHDYSANERLRARGTANLVAAALDLGIERVIGQSISWAYCGGDGPASEDELLAIGDDGQPLYPGVDALEREIARLPIGVVLRYGLLYGPGTSFAPGSSQYQDAAFGRIDAASNHTSFLHIDDAVSATVAALDWPAGQYNIVDDEPTTVAEWGPLYARFAGFAGTPVVTSRFEGRCASNAKARSLGWAPRVRTWRGALHG